MEWNWSHTDERGLSLPQTGGPFTGLSPMAAGDEGQVFPSDMFSEQDVRVKLLFQVVAFVPGDDVWPNYTGYGGSKRSGQAGFSPQDSSLGEQVWGPILGNYGGGVWVSWQSTVSLSVLTPLWSSNRIRFIPMYYDMGVGDPSTFGYELFIIKHMRLGWYRAG